jgi:hypothetical protein
MRTLKNKSRSARTLGKKWRKRKMKPPNHNHRGMQRALELPLRISANVRLAEDPRRNQGKRYTLPTALHIAV